MRTDTFCGLTRMTLVAACGLALAAGAAGLDGPESAPTPGAEAAAASRTASGPGLLAVIDGGGESSLDALLADPDLAAALSTSSVGLYEEYLPDGSVMVDLQGRFRSVAFATISPDGSLQTSHQPLPSMAVPIALTAEPGVCRQGTGVAQETSHAQP